jgi:hypothetical protein
MLLHVSTFKISSSGSSLRLAEIAYGFFGLGRIKLLKYKMVNFADFVAVPQHQQKHVTLR